MSEFPLKELVTHWIRPEIRRLSAYAVPDATGMIKLDAMENPHAWPLELRPDWSRVLGEVLVNRYPDPRARALKARLREAMAVPEGMDLLLGNGSDEIIQMIALSLATPGRALLSVEPSFAMYQMIATLCGMKYVGVPLRAHDFGLDMPAVIQAIEVEQPAVVFLSYPNNPTGNLFAEADILRIIDEAPGLVVIDEAYSPFTDHSLMHRLGQLDNLLVMRTLSKMGLAGLRLGLLAGPRAWLSEINKTRLPYNINVLTQAAAELALGHPEVLHGQANAIRCERARLFEALNRLPGLTVYPSEANFILFNTGPGRAKAVFEGLKKAGILIKKLHGAHPLLTDCLRVTVGTPAENDAFLGALGALI
jgi:histidinol-phosphate aminotransferase